MNEEKMLLLSMALGKSVVKKNRPPLRCFPRKEHGMVTRVPSINYTYSLPGTIIWTQNSYFIVSTAIHQVDGRKERLKSQNELLLPKIKNEESILCFCVISILVFLYDYWVNNLVR